MSIDQMVLAFAGFMAAARGVAEIYLHIGNFRCWPDSTSSPLHGANPCGQTGVGPGGDGHQRPVSSSVLGDNCPRCRRSHNGWCSYASALTMM